MKLLLFFLLSFVIPISNSWGIADFDEEMGAYGLEHQMDDDKNKISFNFNVNANLLEPIDLLGFDIHIARNFEVFWLEAFAARYITYFHLTSSLPSRTSSNPKAEINNPRPDDSKQTLLIAGGGISYRFAFPESLNVLEITHLFQTTSCYITYTSLDDDHLSKTYDGFGLRADYGLHKRFTSKTHFGLKLSYNYSEVKRDKLQGDEVNNDRKLFLSWLALSFDVGLYY